MSMPIDRRHFLAGTAAALATGLPSARPALAQAAGQVVVATWPGAFLAAQKAHYFDPFEKDSGVRVVVANEPGAARIKAMVESGNVEWDLAEVSAAEMLTLQRQNLLEPIDYSGFDKAELAQIVPDVVKSHGVGALFVAQCLGFSTKAFAAGARPRTWADAWDTAKFPGPRAFTAMDFGTRPLEIPLLADGVANTALYPLDVDRAFKALEKIRPNVAKWIVRGVDPGELMSRGEVVMANVSSGRVIAMRDQGAPIDFSFQQGILYPDFWVIPKGAKNAKNAMKLLQVLTGAKQQAAFSAAYPNAPVNKGAYALMTADQAARLPPAPGTPEQVLVAQAEWWQAEAAGGKTNIDAVSERWRKWVV